MDETDQRNLSRDSLFMLADLRLAGSDSVQRVRVRNVSAGGLMVECPTRLMRGQRLEVQLRQIGWVPGVVVWAQETRFGIAFDHEIDPCAARATSGGHSGHRQDFYAHRPLALAAQQLRPDPSRLRKL